MNVRRAIRVSRRVTLALALLAGLYLYLRAELMTLPADGCSPLVGIDPGARLLLDRRPVALGPGDAVLFRGPGGRLHLARVTVPPADLDAGARAACAAGALWVRTERADCEGLDSLAVGPIDRSEVAAEVVAVLPGFGSGAREEDQEERR